MKHTKESLELLAQKFRTEHDLGATDSINIKSLLRQLNILTVFKPMSDKAYGLSVKSGDNSKFILINSNKTKGRQHFTIAHEIFHLFYDENPCPHLCDMEGSNKTEQNANCFASALLMPKDGILKLIPDINILTKNITIGIVLKLEQYFGVSRSSMILRLKSIGLINEARLQELLSIPVIESAKQYGYDLSLYKSGNENLVIGDYGEKARTLFENGKISEGHYVELLNRITNGQN